MYQQVMGGQADACFDDTPILKYSIQAGELTMKFVEGTENEPASYGFAVFNPEKQDKRRKIPRVISPQTEKKPGVSACSLRQSRSSSEELVFAFAWIGYIAFEVCCSDFSFINDADVI